MNFNWLGKTGRKYSLVLFCALISTFAMFFKFCSFIEWATFMSVNILNYNITNHQAKKIDNLEKGQ